MTLDGEHVASGNIAGMATRILRRAGGVILGCFGRGQTGIMLWHSCAGASAALWQRREHRQPRSERVSGPRLSRSSAVLQQTRRPNRSRPPSMKLIGNWRLCVRRPVYHAVVRPLFSAKRTTGVDVNRTFLIAGQFLPFEIVTCSPQNCALASMSPTKANAAAISGSSGVGAKPSSAGPIAACASAWSPVDR